MATDQRPARARQRLAHEPFGDEREGEDKQELQSDIEPEGAQHWIARLLLEPGGEARHVDHHGGGGQHLFADRLDALRDLPHDRRRGGFSRLSLDAALRQDEPAQCLDELRALRIVLQGRDQALQLGVADRRRLRRRRHRLRGGRLR